MYLCFFLVNILFFPIINSSNSTIMHVKENSTKTLPPLNSNKIKSTQGPSVPIVSEGGSLLPSVDTPSLVSGEQNNTLLRLDMEMGKDKVKPIARRKGVIYDFKDSQPKSSELPQEKLVVTSHLSKLLSNNTTSNSTTKILPIIHDDKSLNKTGNITETKIVVPKKPLVLSYEALASMDHDVNKLPEIKSSSGTLADQILSPNKEPVYQHASNANKHPGMIMPVVITILVVPMFAVLGYMALKRGKEAWKNRHYKRMDFLLDGMYNE